MFRPEGPELTSNLGFMDNIKESGGEKVKLRFWRRVRSSLLRFWPKQSERLFLRERPVPGLRTVRGGSILLVEMTSHVAADWFVPLSTFLDAYQTEKPGTEPIGYVPDLVLEPMLPSLVSRTRDVAFYKTPSVLRRIYRACGIRQFQLQKHSPARKRESDRIATLFLDRNPTRREIQRWSVHGVKIGDLLYDHFLRAYGKPTVVVTDPTFRAFATRFIGAFLYWKEFFEANSVSGVIAANPEYGTGLPLRLASCAGIPGFYLQMDSVVTVSKEMGNPHNVMLHNLRKDFLNADQQERERAFDLARARLQTRLNGGIDPDIGYMPSSSFSPGSGVKVIEHTKRTNVLVATHCASDAANIYGEGIFSDHWEWLHFIGEMSLKHDYDWYVKEHPAFSQNDRDFLKQMVHTYPSLRLVPGNVSNHQLARQGLAAVLTVFGSVGHEFPMLGVPVINCSLNNPHKEWDFNFHAGDLDSLVALIRRIPELQVGSGAGEAILEFFAARAFRARREAPLFLRHNYAGARLIARGHDEAITQQWKTEFRSSEYLETIAEVREVVSASADANAERAIAGVFSRGSVRRIL